MSDSVNPFDEMTRAWGRMMSAWAAPLKGDDGESDSTRANAREMMERMQEVHLATMEAGFRYVRRWAELSSRAYPLAFEAMVAASQGKDDADAGAARDELRETLREMTELPMDESRRLQNEFASLWGPVSEEKDPEGGQAPRRRRAKAKP